MVRYFIDQGKEGDFWDFKQEWHEKTEDLIKDIICFANTVHDKNCYLIFGVSDDLQITGMQKPRTKQANIIDTISNLFFAGDVYPKIEVNTVEINGCELDVLTVYNIESTPIYLKKPYGKMRAGCIYLRIGDKNTPDNGNADVTDIENLWRKRFGLTKPPLEYIFDRMHNKMEWTELNGCYYNSYRPEYTLQIVYKGNDYNVEPEFYAYAMKNSNISSESLNIMFQNTVLDSYPLVVLDGARLEIPTPEIESICYDAYQIKPKYSYGYYISNSNRYKVLLFLYDSQNDEANTAFRRLKEVILIYHSQEERSSFELFLEGHQSLVDERFASVDQYSNVTFESECKTKVYQERLKIGVALNKLLAEWRSDSI